MKGFHNLGHDVILKQGAPKGMRENLIFVPDAEQLAGEARMVEIEFGTLDDPLMGNLRLNRKIVRKNLLGWRNIYPALFSEDLLFFFPTTRSYRNHVSDRSLQGSESWR